MLSCAPVAVQAETLEDAVLRAYETNPSIEITRALTRASDEGVIQAEGAYGPTLIASAAHEYTYTKNHVSNLVFPDDGFATRAQLSLTQPLFTSGRLSSALNQAEAERMVSHQELRGTSQQLVFDVISAYVTLRRDLELYSVASDIYQLLAEQRNLTGRRLELRDATSPDVDQTENRMELAAGRVIQARGNVEASAAQYRRLVGDYPEELAPPPPLPPLPPLEQIYAQAEQSNPTILGSRYTEIASQAQLAASRAELLPSVTANASAGRRALSTFSNSNYAEQIVVGVSVSTPIYTGGVLTSRVRQSLARNVAAQQFVEESRRGVRQNIATDWNLLQSAEIALPRYYAAVSAAQRAVDGVKQQETAGIRTLRDVLDVTNDLFNARTISAQTQADRYIQHAAVLLDAGQLTIDLFAQRAEYDPADYNPAASWSAGFPLRTVLDPLDSLLVRDHVREVPVVVEDDLRYERGEELTLPPAAPGELVR